jgi:hypothetical protein
VVAHRRLIAVYLDVSAINTLDAFYDIHGRERCYSLILSRTLHETVFLLLFMLQAIKGFTHQMQDSSRAV